ncbi:MULTISPECIES: efflux RND transporter periplasmic adaptor subunit [Alteromonadaceae]|jgi:RND family efflux transporter MFP subunit|uniref:Efflux RND transporter periplasmic adaptor subunit n=1 Tax=Brumicola blandensis TaxID=3075611 RepID=A0AAW8QWZ0_9ALTE|nr:MULTISPECIES: efflux RND transporter periplasmic adaptor subunit [unclassified Alteromonas]MDT0581150.1 efflux RND transporter periplasmic adaptor subunit [Alteromonas sp. W409]MDT0626767.1 efflux RND transporter periplasmic adaptor subunit [Alteromonas sp. W364]
MTYSHDDQANKSSSLQLLLCSSILALTVSLSACGQAAANKDSEQAGDVVEEKIIPIPVEVDSVAVGSISSNYQTTAVLEAKEEAFVVGRASGIIEEIMVEEGDYVEKGQVLAKLEPTRYELALKRAEADMQGIEKELAKINKVYNQKLVSDDTYDKITAQYESAKATLALAELDLKEATIVAPISGYIAERNAKVGNLTESFQRERMFHIVQQKELYGIVYLPEKELSKVHKDQKAGLIVTALSDKPVNAFVERISPVIDSKTGTFKVTLRVPNDENQLKSGMFTQVKLNYDTRDNTTLIPRKAMLAIDDKVNVFVVDDQGMAKKVAVKIGYQEGNLVEVIDGLMGTEKVVITGHQNLKDNATVEIVNG